MDKAENANAILGQLGELVEEEASVKENHAKKLKDVKQHYDQLLAEEKEKYRAELRRVTADKRTLQDDIIEVIMNPARQKKFLRSVPVHQLPVSNMLRSLLLNAGYDTLGDILNRPLERLSRDTVTNQTYTSELKKFLLSVGL